MYEGQRALKECRLLNSTAGIALGIHDFAARRRNLQEIGIVQWDKEVTGMFSAPVGSRAERTAQTAYAPTPGRSKTSFRRGWPARRLRRAISRATAARSSTASSSARSRANVTPLDDLPRELLAQAAFLRDREPVYERLLALFGDAIRGEFGSRLARLWADRTFNSTYERPLLLLAALRYDALCESVSHPLYGADAPARLSALPGSMFVLCVQTIVRDYLATVEREQYEAGMREFLMSRPPLSALIAELEVDPGSLEFAGKSATVVVRFRTTENTLNELVMARTHPHPRQLFTNAGAVSAFTSAFRPD